MFHKFCSTRIQYFRPLFLFAFAILQAAGLHAHQDRMNAQIRDQGLFLAARPAKISIKLPDQPVLAGSKPQLAIALWKETTPQQNRRPIGNAKYPSNSVREVRLANCFNQEGSKRGGLRIFRRRARCDHYFRQSAAAKWGTLRQNGSGCSSNAKNGQCKEIKDELAAPSAR
jgi:hypothetical protein